MAPALVGALSFGNEWYEWAVPVADELCDVYLDELRQEGWIC